MKAIKRIMIVFAILGVLMEGFFLAVKYGTQIETEKIRTEHSSYASQVTQADGSYVYSFDGEEYSEADYLALMNKTADASNVLMIAQGALIGFFIIGATAAGKSVKRREETAQAAIC